MQEQLDNMLPDAEVAERFIPPTPSRLLPYLATLSSSNIPHHVETWRSHTWHIVVPAAWADRAREELLAYERDNRDWPRPLHSEATTRRGRGEARDLFGGAAVFAGLLLLFFRLGPRDATSAYHVAGALDTERVLAGEWWRAVTSLTLHADLAHVLANAVCACVFGIALSQLLGSGIAWLLVLMSGTLGNLAEAYLAGPGRLAIGASTATFGALGALGVLQTLRHWNGWRDARSVFSRTWIPIAAAAILLGWMGSGPRADIVGHVLGFLSGMTLGAMARPLLTRTVAWYWHLLAALLAAGILAQAWRLALAGH